MALALLKLLMAHILGDFFLQPNSWVIDKEKRRLKSGKLYLHIALHIALIFLMFCSLTIWKVALIIGFMHGIIDVTKLIFQKAQTKRIWFFVDQFLHIAVILICWQYIYHSSINIAFYLQSDQLWLFLLGALFLTSPAAIFIRVIIAKWIPSKASTSLQDAGKFIGILERLLIYLFVCTNHFEAVGFLLAAKSIFRFGDLKEAHDIKLTEYVLIGTLLSFGIALIVAMAVINI
ncbi:DUF3307 domain-containing protein [Pedobacter boryungensis]|uniref:DUF3307 domain-containing protein n=1 Tax=Pedobacter boryungensis TaxID=869962 RepID=A0ABX2DAU5_9SPHI|nr:DUF3307 domain-containing protein [Pedobacter boryungensis]NQX30699.1 DUF3307 domain-containing protein [Pedobacter boryungensis]